MLARSTLPSPLAAILAPGNDVGRCKAKCGTAIVGYVYDVKPGPVECVNCSARQVADRDTQPGWP